MDDTAPAPTRSSTMREPLLIEAPRDQRSDSLNEASSDRRRSVSSAGISIPTTPSLRKKRFAQRSSEEVARERERHERAEAALLALRSLVHARQRNSLTLGGLHGADLLRHYFATFYARLLAPFASIVSSMRVACCAACVPDGGATMVHAGTDEESALSKSEEACWMKAVSNLGLAIALSAALPFLLLPLVLASLAVVLVAPIVGVMCLGVLLSVAEFNSALVTTLMTLNPFAPWSQRVLHQCTFVQLAETDATEADALATQLKSGYEACGLRAFPRSGGFMTESAPVLVKRITRAYESILGRDWAAPQYLVLNIYTWRYLKVYALVWHFTAGVALLVLAAWAKGGVPWGQDTSWHGLKLAHLWYAYLVLLVVTFVGLSVQLLEEQSTLYGTSNPFAEDLWERLSSRWLDLGTFCVSTADGERVKLRAAVLAFADRERSADEGSEGSRETLGGRFKNAKLVTGRPRDAALGIVPFLGVTDQEVWAGLSRGVEAIVEEFERNGTDVDRECLRYVLHEAAGSSPTTFQEGLRRDCDRHGRLLPERLNSEGEPMRLADFVAHSASTQARLMDAHVLALRVCERPPSPKSNPHR